MAEANPLEDAALAIASKMTGNDKSYAFDPILIVTLLSFVMDLFKDCGANRGPESFAKVAKNPGLFQRAALMSRCRKSVDGNREARALYKATLDAAEEASEEQIADCCRAAQTMDAAA